MGTGGPFSWDQVAGVWSWPLTTVECRRQVHFCLVWCVPDQEQLCLCFLPVPKNKQTPCPESASELYRQSDLCLSAKLVPTFTDRGYHVVSVADPYGRILDFLDRSRYFFFQVAPQLYSRGWVDPVSDPPLLRKSGSAENRIRTSGSVTRNSDH
jgi:hypothetical protein